MPKKTQGRPAKGRARARRPQQRSGQAPAPAPAAPVDDVAPVSVPNTQAAAVPSTRRGAARRAVGITINYAYLRHDLRTLAVLAPLMVVLLIVSYFIFHTA